MSNVIAPGKTVTFTIARDPRRVQDCKTIQRLMRMQPEIQRGLQRLQHKRAKEVNATYVRAGVEWTNRAKATRLTRPVRGETFTLRLTPQILPDVKAVERLLEAKPA